MENESIKKINKMGKIAYIITKIVNICLIIGLVAVIGLTVATFVISNDIFEVKYSGNAQVTVNKDVVQSTFGKTLANKLDDIDEDSFKFEFDENNYGNAQVLQGEDNVIINASTDVYTITLKEISFILIALVVVIGNTLALMIRVKGLCKSFRDCTTPFEDSIIEKMRKLAIHLIPWCVIDSLASSVAKSCITGKLDISIGINTSTIIAVLIIMAITYVFRYGANLQKEADETL